MNRFCLKISDKSKCKVFVEVTKTPAASATLQYAVIEELESKRGFEMGN